MVTGLADNLIATVDRIRESALRAVRSQEVGHRPVLPEERVGSAVAGGAGPSDDDAGIVDVPGHSEVTAKCAQVTHLLAVPEVWMGSLIAGEAAETHDVTAVVQPTGLGLGAAEGAEVAHVAVGPQERVAGRDTGR